MGRDVSNMPSRASQYLLMFMATAALWVYCLWTLNYFPPAARFFIQIVRDRAPCVCHDNHPLRRVASPLAGRDTGRAGTG